MGEIIRDWLRTRLGIIIDLSPEIFGHFARDGTLLAKVLHSYDVINDSQLSTLLQTQDPALSRVNLKHLRVWLKFVGVDCDNDCIEDISNGKGTMALRLFYKVFLCLENKDRLHFITLQKEREKYIPSSSKFDVTTVSEEPEVEESNDQPYAALLRRSASLVDWQRRKYRKLTDACNDDELSAPKNDDKAPETATSGTKRKSLSRRKKTGALGRPKELRELDEFAKKHRIKRSKEASETRDSTAERSSGKSIAPKINEEAARAYTESLRNKRRQEALTKSFKTRMQKNLLNDLWKKVLDDQETEFDEIIAKKVLHQSQYEKQLVRKLCDVRSQKKRTAANRGIVEKLVEETREKEMRLDQERAREIMVRENEEVEAEGRRIEELERRIEEQSRRRKSAKIRRLAEKICLDLIDIAVKVCQYEIEHEDQVPRSLMNQWKVLFLNNQSIVEAQDEIMAEDELEREEDREEIEIEDEGRTKVLNNEDFENYHRINSPWKDFVPDVDDEVREYLNLGLLVLGHIVHKTLNSLDSEQQTESVESRFPAMKTRAAVLGIPDALLYEPIQELLNNSNVNLVRIEEAINYCLSRYKAEMKDFEYIDLEIISATREARNSSSIPSEPDESGKSQQRKNKKASSGKSKTVSSIEKIVEPTKKGVEKVTQTPRVIPHEDEDPSLSNAAYFGKWIHEFLTLGQPLSDELISRTIAEYLRSLSNVQGFVLVNYPNTYRETSLLELVLGGRRLPRKRDKSWNETGNGSIEEIADSYVPRIIFEDESSDFETWRESRLVPNPTKSIDTTASSCLTSFVRIKEKSSDKKEDDDIWEILPDDGTSVDAFYADREIASILYYEIFDLATLKKLVRLVVAGKDELISGASSNELFGDYLRYFDGRREDDYSLSKAAIVKKLLPLSRTSEYSSGETRSTSSIESRKIASVEALLPSTKNGSVLPGAVEWSWADFSQPSKHLRALGDLWRSLETSYVENLMETFHLKRMTLNAIAPYADSITRHMREFINRPDTKQDSLHEFHRAFNEIDREIRDDSAVARHLYCRVDDFETRLWEICDSRRRQAEEERRRIIEENWTSCETIDIANIYIDILQFEIDRCNETLQFVNDYYTSMLKSPLREIRTSVSPSRIETMNFDSSREIRSGGTAESGVAKARESKEARTKPSVSQIPRAPFPPDENLVKIEITKFLSDLDEGNLAATRTLCYKLIEENIRFIENVVESLAARVLDGLEREETKASESPSEDKKRSTRKNARSIEFATGNDGKGVENLFLEWRYASIFEINRIRVRLKILDAAARSDIGRLLNSSRQLFSDIRRDIIDRYQREIKSVNDMASIFRYAIEEATPIQEEMLLDGDRFLVRSNVLMFPTDGADAARAASDENDISPSSRFSASRLARLADIFLRSAPTGSMSERSFVYIIQDLIVCDEDRGENSILPSPWYQLRACDVVKLVDELFGDVEYVDWREFIIYAMGIDAPSVDEILRDYRGFRDIDVRSDEFVTREDFSSVRLWFADVDGEIETSCRPDERPEGDEPPLNSRSDLERDEPKAEAEPRPEMTKELLGKIFSYDDRRVNYVALLMAFCKDEKPEIGLGKALSLAIGDKVCIDWEIGEEYARESQEAKISNVETNGNDARAEATKISRAIVKWTLKNFLRSIEFQGVEKLEESNAAEELIGKNDDRRSTDGEIPISANSRDTLTSDRGKENSRLSITISLPKENAPARSSRTEERSMIHWLDFNVAQSVLAAMLPSHAAQQNILETGKSLRENLQLVRLELHDQGIKDESGATILSHRFIHHDFVRKLLADTGKFTMRKLSGIIDGIINDNR